MNVHPLRPHSAESAACADRASTYIDDDFPYDFHEDFAEFQDADESMHRYGSLDRQYRHAHRTISATVLATLTGIRIPVCQVFHSTFFGLLEDVGDCDGLIATPGLLIAGRHERLAAASDWLDGHSAPDGPALIAAADLDEPSLDLDRRIIEAIEQHSLDLAIATGTNPSLTLGSTAALYDRVIDEILDLVLSCQVDEIDRLTDGAIDLLSRLPTPIRLVGGAVLHRLGGSPSEDTANVGMVEV